MTLSASQILRLDEVGGIKIATFDDGTAKHFQGVALVDNGGAQAGLQLNPLHVQSAGFAPFGRATVGDDVHVWKVNGDKWVDPRVVGTYVEGYLGAQVPAVSPDFGGLGEFIIKAGLGGGNLARLEGQIALPYIPGIGISVGFVLRVPNHATGVANQIRRFGMGDTTDGIFIEHLGTGTFPVLKVYVNGSAAVSVDGDDWDTAVDNTGGLWNANINAWEIQFDPASMTTRILLNGTQVHKVRTVGTATLVRTHDYRFRCEATQTSTTAQDLGFYVQHVFGLYQGAKHILGGLARHRAHFAGAITGETEFFGMLHNKSRVNNAGNTIKSNRPIRIRRIRVEALDEDDHETHFMLYIKKNAVIVDGTIYAYSHPTDMSSYATSNFTAAETATNATGPGWSATNVVNYKLAAYGAIGLTEATAPFLGVASAAATIKQIHVQMETAASVPTPYPNAGGYYIYRNVEGGTYYLVAIVDAFTMHRDGWTDNAFTDHASAVPIGADTTLPGSFIGAVTLPTSTAGGHTFMTTAVSLHNDSVIDFEDGELILNPGESLSGYFANTEDGLGAVTVEWDEEQ